MFVESLSNSSFEWEDFLQVMPGSTFYHSLKWKEVIERSFPVQTSYSVVRNDNGKIVGLCPACVLTRGNTRVFDSLPFSDFGGPLVEKKYLQQAGSLLYRAIEEFCRGNEISFAKFCFSRGGCEKIFKSARCYISDNQGSVYLDLTSKPSAFVWKNLESKQRQKIRKLEKNGLSVREAASKSDLKTFLSLYYQNMRHLGVPAFRPDFFENVWDLLYPENFTVLIAEMKAPVGGIGFFKYGKTIYLTYFGMNRESLQGMPAVAPFLFWKSITWAEGKGFTNVWFGSTPTHPQNSGEKANYSQKMAFSGSFQPQEIIYLPFDLRSSITFLVAPEAIKYWKSIRNVWPLKLQKMIENQLGDRLQT